MNNSLLLAWRYMSFHRGSTAVLVLALSLTIFLPLAARWGVQRFQQHALQRATSTPLILGTKGSRFGLAIHALYFRGESPQAFHLQESHRIKESGLAEVIELHARFRTRGATIVGTTKRYFELRGLRLASGQPLRRLGDCVVGAAVASRLGIQPGDRLLSESDNLFDLSGPAPLNMRVTGLLARTGASDDEAVLCDLETTWLIEGIGHGHAIQGDADEENHQHSAGRQYLQAHQEVTDENVNSFHFHGKRSQFPITALIALPTSEKSEALLLGRYLSPDQTLQMIRPVEVVQELLQVISHLRRLFDLSILLLTVATALLAALVLTLSLRLRQREMRTFFLLGCSRGKAVQVVATQLVLVVLIAVSLSFLAASAVSPGLEWLFIRLMSA
jgi:putative ABC transport system permease protein